MPKYKIHYNDTEIVLDGVQFHVRDGFHVFVDENGDEVCRIANGSLHAIFCQDNVKLMRPIPGPPVKVVRSRSPL